MKKKHRNKHIPGIPHPVRLKVKDVVLPQDAGYDKNKSVATDRMNWNLANTGHPLHHQTLDGTIVEPDPSLEEMMTHVSPDEMPPIPAALPGALPTVPVDRHWYEHEPGRTFMARWLASQRRKRPKG